MLFITGDTHGNFNRIEEFCSENDTTKEDLLKAMLDEYEVTEDIAKKDIDNFITKLKDGNLLE